MAVISVVRKGEKYYGLLSNEKRKPPQGEVLIFSLYGTGVIALFRMAKEIVRLLGIPRVINLD